MSSDLDLLFYPSSEQRWGFRFAVPMYRGHMTLHVSCETRLCDPETELKPTCDRSCLNETKPKSGRRSRDPRSSEGHVDSGPLIVLDAGYGPVIDKRGFMHRVRQQTGNDARCHHTYW